MLRTMIAVGAALMLLGSMATAQTRSAVKACAADIETHCGKFGPGGAEVRSKPRLRLTRAREIIKLVDTHRCLHTGDEQGQPHGEGTV